MWWHCCLISWDWHSRNASCCRETSVIWVSIDVPTGQPPGQYEGEIIISAMKTDGGWVSLCIPFLWSTLGFVQVHLCQCENDYFVHHGFDILITNYVFGNSGSSHLAKHEKDQLCVELNTCLDIMEPIEGKPMDEVVIFTFLVLYCLTFDKYFTRQWSAAYLLGRKN